MKKLLSLFVAVAFALSGFVMPVSAEGDLAAGTVVKTESSSTLYYVGDDGKLYVFPNANTYFSWFDEFENITVITEEEFASYQLGGNVNYKPGSLLIKTPSSLKVYAVGMNGELRWIESEEMAQEFYGDNWNKLVDDVPDSFFTNYSEGESIDEVDDYDPEEEAELAPTISYNKGFKVKEKIKNRVKDRKQKRCEYLKNSVNRLQKRAERWGIEVPNLGEDFVEACTNVVTEDDVVVEDENGEGEDGEEGSDDHMIYICKVPPGNANAAHTIKVAKPALKAHLKKGSYIGKCGGDDDSSDEDEDEGDEGDDDTVEALEISAISESLTASSALVSWTTNVAADSMIEYSLNSDLSSSSMEEMSDDVTDHEILLQDLEVETMYYYMITSEDADANIATSAIRSFTTDAIDEVDEDAPVISEVSATTTSETAIITWDTDEDADSRIVYALESIASTTSTEEATDAEYVSTHGITLESLASSTMYYFYVESTDEAGNTAKSEEYTFETLE